MKSQYFRRMLSLLLTVLMTVGVFALPVSASVPDLPTRDDLDWFTKNNAAAYGAADALHSIYGMPVYDIEAQTDRNTGLAQHFEWYKGSGSYRDYLQVYYPDHIYLDKNETLEAARYTLLVLAHYGDDEGYRAQVNGRFWGEVMDPVSGGAINGADTTMYSVFDNFGHLATMTDGTSLLRNGSTHDLTGANTRQYHHAEFAVDNEGYIAEFWNGSRNQATETAVLGSGETTVTNKAYKEHIFLTGTPKVLGTYAYEDIREGGAYGALLNTGSSSLTSTFKNTYVSAKPVSQSGINMWSSLVDQDELGIRILVTVYDKEALNTEIGVADAFDAANAPYVSKYLTSGNWDAFTAQLAASRTVLTTRELGTYPELDADRFGNDGYLNYIAIPEGADPAQTVINESESALDAAKRAVTFAASDAALYSRINALETLLSGHEDEYTAASVSALRARIAEVKALRTAKSAARTGEQYTTDGFSFADTATPGASAAAEQAIIDAVTFPELVRKSDAPADFSEYVIWDNEHDAPDPCHTAESIANYNEKLAVIADMYARRADYTADDQPTVDAAMDDVVAAWDALVVEHGRAAEPTWTWTPVYAKDGETVVAYTAATAFLACDRNHGHDQTVTDTALDVTGGDPDCEHAAEKTYTASVVLKDKDDAERTYTDTKTVTLPATGHDYKFSEFEWTETAEGFTAKAVLVCKNDASHEIKEDAVVTYVGEANCDAPVERVYTATYDGHTDTRTKTLAVVAHDWDLTPDNVVWSWTPILDEAHHIVGYTATATVKCRNYDTHVITKDAAVTSDVTKPATETEEGNTRYTATVEIEGVTFTDEKNEPIPTTEHVHTYEFDHFQWKPVYDENLHLVDFEGCDAVIVCEGHPDHTYSVPLEVLESWVNGIEPDCDVAASRRYAVSYTFNGETYTSESDIPAAALGHEWGEAVWTWTPVYEGDAIVGYNASLTVPCVRGDHATLHDHDLVWSTGEAEGSPYQLTLTETRVEPKCQVSGSVTYTPAVPANLPEGFALDPATVPTRSVLLPAFDHNWEFKGFTWTGSDETGYTAAVADFECRLNHDHKKTEAAVLTTATVPADCEHTGKTTYTATYGDQTEEKVITLELIDHDWKTGRDDILWSWTDNGDGTYAVTATFVCSRYNTHTVTKTATVTKEQTKAPTEDEKGETTHTAKVEGPDGNEYTDEKKTEIPALPHTHSYEFDHFNWVEIKDADDNVTGYEPDMTATLVCQKDGDEKTENVTATVKHTEPACQVEGSDVYTAVYGDRTETKTVLLPALDHDWNAPSWTVSADKKTATATFVCKLNSAHVYTATCDLTETVLDEPTPDEKGEKEYTGSVTGPDGETYDYRETEDIDPLGHVFEGPVWTWTGSDEEGWTADAAFTCTTETGHVEHPAVTMSNTITKAPTCEGFGVKTYTAVTVFEGKTYTATKNVTLPATGHDWGAPTAKWDGATVTVTVVCRNDASHVRTLDAAVTANVEVEPFCTTTGNTHYTAVVEYEGETYTFESDVITPALGHDWDAWEVLKEATITEHGLERRVCSRCGEVEERETSIQGEGVRKIQFTNMNDMHFVVQMLYHERAVFHNSEALKWYTNLPLTFRIVSYSSYDYTKYVVYANRQIIAPNEDGSYTIPAGAEYTVITVTGASANEGSSGSSADQTPGASKGKLSFMDALTAFFRRLADFFRNLFK